MKMFILIVAFILSGISGPFLLNKKLYRNNYTKLSSEALKLISNEIKYKATPLPEIIRRISTKYNIEYYKKLSNTKTDIYQYNEKWNDAVLSDFNLEKESRNILLHVGSILGKTTSDRQFNLLNNYADELNDIYKERKKELKRLAKLYNSAGILLGMFIVVIFI